MLMGQVRFKLSLKNWIWQCDKVEIIADLYKSILGEWWRQKSNWSGSRGNRLPAKKWKEIKSTNLKIKGDLRHLLVCGPCLDLDANIDNWMMDGWMNRWHLWSN